MTRFKLGHLLHISTICSGSFPVWRNDWVLVSRFARSGPIVLVLVLFPFFSFCVPSLGYRLSNVSLDFQCRFKHISFSATLIMRMGETAHLPMLPKESTENVVDARPWAHISRNNFTLVTRWWKYRAFPWRFMCRQCLVLAHVHLPGCLYNRGNCLS